MLPAMPAKKKPRRRQIPHGRRIDVARIVSVGQGREIGTAIYRFRDQDGRLLALRLKPLQFRTLANGVRYCCVSR